MPKVSVIIPAYNAEKTIGKCLQALIGQFYPAGSYEIIVVDDGSTDNTGKIAKEHDIHYIRQDNQGPAAARNRGCREARGGILLFTDSDCVPDADWIKEMVKPFKDSKVMAVKGAYRTKQKNIVARFAQLEFEERFEILKRAESIDMIDTYSAGFRKEAFIQMGGFDTSFPVANNEDTELSYRMSKSGFKMVFNPGAIVYHLDHPDSIKRYAWLKFWRGYWRTMVYKKFPDKMLKDSYTPQTLKLQILFLFLFALVCPVTLFFPAYGIYPMIFLGIINGFLFVPFLLFALKRDPVIGLFVPFLLFVRAISIGLGTAWGVFRFRRV